MYRIFNVLSNTYVWVSLFLVALIISVDVQFEIYLLPCSSKEFAENMNNFLMTLSYSYIASAMFHFFVNFCPYKMRCQSLMPYENHLLMRIRETLRQCKELGLPTFDLNNTNYNRDEYIKVFAQMDFLECYPFGKEKTRYDRMLELRQDIITTVDSLMVYKEYLSDNIFSYVCHLAESPFLMTYFAPKDNMIIENNQRDFGEWIFDLYEQSLQLQDISSR